MPDLSYAVIGTGALGGLYGAMLARAGREVHFLLRSDYDHVRDHGLRIETVWGDFDLPDVNAHARPDDLPPVDVTLVATKTTLGDAVADLIRPPTSGGGVALVLQNGLDVERPITDAIGRDRTLSGCCFLCSNKVGPGHIRHLDEGRIVFGPLGQTDPSLVRRIADDFTAAGVPVKTSTDIAAVRWRKLLWNIPFNGLSVVLDAATDELIRDPAATALASDLIEEIATAAAAVGVTIPPEAKTKTIEATRAMVPYDSSMRVDYRHGRELEIAAIFDAPIAAAAAAGVAMPRTQTLRDQLRFLDARNRHTP